jgi:uncharacterized membrane protein
MLGIHVQEMRAEWRRGTGPSLRRRRKMAALLGGTAVAGAVGALDYLRDMIFVERRACPYCLVGAVINFALVPLAAREAADSVRSRCSSLGRKHAQ